MRSTQSNKLEAFRGMSPSIYRSSIGRVMVKKWSYWLSLDVQLALQKLHQDGRIGQMAPSHYVGTDTEGNYCCMSWVVLDTASVVAVTTGMRAQRFSAVCVRELVGLINNSKFG